MPVTAKLSRLFYERLGDQIANELAEWLNQVDQSYRSDLRELNEMNFARFDAKLEQRIAEVNAKIDQRCAQLDAKIDRVAAELNAKIDQRIAELRAELSIKIAELEAKMERRFTEQNRWLVGTFATMILGFAGLGLGMIGLWLRH